MLSVETLWHLAHGRTTQAVEAASEAVAVFRREWILNLETVHCLPMLARALREHAAALEADHPSQARQLRAQGLRVARWGARLAYWLRLEYPFALRELSLAWAAQGRRRRALRYARKSCVIAEQQGAAYEHAQSLLVCGTLCQRLGRAEADEQIENAQSSLAAFRRSIETA